MKIDKPSLEELSLCFALEEQYSFHSPNAAQDGFFLPGSQFSLYEQLYETGYIRSAVHSSGELAAFILAVPPRHSILQNLLSNPDFFQLDNQRFPDAANTVWVAKVASAPQFKRSGLARKLYQHLFLDFPSKDILTATALLPVQNTVSEQFHASLGMNKIGTYTGTLKGTDQKTINTVWKHAE